jgi:hypothetical protein
MEQKLAYREVPVSVSARGARRQHPGVKVRFPHPQACTPSRPGAPSYTETPDREG